MRRAVPLVLLAFVGCREPAPPAPPPTPTEPEPSFELRVGDVVRRAAPAVVTIRVENRGGQSRATGAGFVVGADGLIATSLHVIGEARPIEVELADGRKFDVTRIRAFDRNADLALLRIPADDLSVLPIGDPSTLEDGAPIIALGNPLGFERSVLTGFVSARRQMGGREMIQLSMPIEPGNSGGPIVDLEGRVHGVVTMKSMVTKNLGFAVSIDEMRPLHERPNSVTMSRWLTIGALDEKQWTTLFGARWRQRAGRIEVDRPGYGMAGRSLCLSREHKPRAPYVVSAEVRLDDEEGAAGITFASNGAFVHYGFYPTRGRLRLTRFEGQQVYSWRILHDQPHPAYRPGEWNRLEVQHERDRIVCLVNGQRVAEIEERTLDPGYVGFVKFRDTKAEMRRLEVRPAGRPAKLTAADRFDREAEKLEWRAARLRAKAEGAHRASVHAALRRAVENEDLARAALLVGRLDNRDVDVDAYVRRLDDMAKRIPSKQLAALDHFLFVESGYHGSRDEHGHPSNNHLSSVIDDREGIDVTLAVLYVALGQRLGLTVSPTTLPGASGRVVVRTPDGLVDPFNGGEHLSETEAAALVRHQAGRPIVESDFAPTPTKAIVRRLLENLEANAAQRSDAIAQLRYLDAALSVAPEDVRTRYRRAHLRVRAGMADEAAKDFETILASGTKELDLADVEKWLDMLLKQKR